MISDYKMSIKTPKTPLGNYENVFCLTFSFLVNKYQYFTMHCLNVRYNFESSDCRCNVDSRLGVAQSYHLFTPVSTLLHTKMEQPPGSDPLQALQGKMVMNRAFLTSPKFIPQPVCLHSRLPPSGLMRSLSRAVRRWTLLWS